ncbi:MAG: C40 family peptidase [Pyrinomonadaceae bacterium]|nr:C40 family peptidase [Pyrinomonadaceae bacterium]MCX7640399.1 C40 family peptidase [Pyrinomonadaceae bacterium]MDW8304827.1 C40 family peptidase [Acidobacteriota bacterium]
MKNFLLACLFSFSFVNIVSSQAIRPRIVETIEAKRPIEVPVTKTLITQPKVNQPVENRPMISKTADVKPVSSPVNFDLVPKDILKNSLFDSYTTSLLFSSIQTKLGFPYRYGSEGPDSYDCSGFIWSVFQSAGIDFERTSAKKLWIISEPVSEEEKYKFGTLVFFNRLGHVGIVVNEKGFYHASRTKGIVYSPFAGYWEKRIVGFRKLNLRTTEPEKEKADLIR